MRVFFNALAAPLPCTSIHWHVNRPVWCQGSGPVEWVCKLDVVADPAHQRPITSLGELVWGWFGLIDSINLWCDRGPPPASLSSLMLTKQPRATALPPPGTTARGRVSSSAGPAQIGSSSAGADAAAADRDSESARLDWSL